MTEPVWVPFEAILLIHDTQIQRYGGSAGMRDVTLLEAACNRAVNKWHYENAHLYDLAAAYAFGIAKAHAFIDGNKRTAFVTAGTFLQLNGYDLAPPADQTVHMMEGLAAGTHPERLFAQWLTIYATEV